MASMGPALEVPDGRPNRRFIAVATLVAVAVMLVGAVLGYEWGVAVRAGCFCAHPGMMHLLQIDSDRRDALLDRVKADDDARQEYIDLLEVLGPDDPRTAQYRKALTARLF